MSEQSKRRDRRKAKQSGWAREGTAKPQRVGHHLYTDPRFDSRVRPRAPKPLPADPRPIYYSDGNAITSLGHMLRDLFGPSPLEPR